MKINEINEGDTVYYPRWGRRVEVIFIDEKSEYVRVKDFSGNGVDVHCSHLQEITGDDDMSWGDILRREG